MNLSVALCTYNGEKYLEEQLTSIIQQTVPIDEIIICDDGSSDRTINIVESFQAKYPKKIQLYKNEFNLGLIKNFEKAIKLSNGDIIFLSDQDDIWKENKVETTVDFFQKHTQYDAVFSNASFINDISEIQEGNMWQLIGFDTIANSNTKVDILKQLVFFRNVVTGACLAFKKEAKKCILPFPKIPDVLHDEWIALQLSQGNKIYFINEMLIKYRLHSNQQSNVLDHTAQIETRKVEKSIKDGNASSLHYYQHWKRRSNFFLSRKQYGLLVPDEFIKEMLYNKKIKLMEYYKTFSFIKRKKALLRNWIKNTDGISLKDVIEG